jgi:hypothetical protein
VVAAMLVVIASGSEELEDGSYWIEEKSVVLNLIFVASSFLVSFVNITSADLHAGKQTG